jgi:hypothetical protein
MRPRPRAWCARFKLNDQVSRQPMMTPGNWRYHLKILLAIPACVCLCACAFSPAPRDAYGEDQYVTPRHQTQSGLADPRTYMDKGDPDIQKLISSHSVYVP